MRMHHPRPDTQAIGRAAEDVAAAFYLRAGFHLVARNFRTRRSEIDLVLARGEQLLFVEVKGRAGAWEPHAWKPRWREKRRRLDTGMREFLARHPDYSDRYEEFCVEIAFVTQGRVSARFREW
jgi:putative endonuclease